LKLIQTHGFYLYFNYAQLSIETSSPLLEILLPRMLDDAFKLTIDQLFDSGHQE